MGRLINEDRTKQSPLSGLEVFEVKDVDGRIYETTIADMLADTGPSEFTLVSGNGTTANGTAVDLGGTASSDILIAMGTHAYGISGLPSGATQVGAGAATNELWSTLSHATLPDGVLMIGL